MGYEPERCLITFSDNSVLRLDADTTVELTTHTNTAGDSIAAIILADGQLWGRVLTSTGMDFGAGGYIVGVRGTSLSVSKSDTTVTIAIIHIAIIDSTNAIAATITNTNNATTPFITVDAGSKVIELSGATEKPTEEPGITKATLLTETWTRENTLDDLRYLGDTLQTDTTDQRVKDEIIASLPTPAQIDTLAPAANTETKNNATTEINTARSDSTNATQLIETLKNIECAKL